MTTVLSLISQFRGALKGLGTPNNPSITIAGICFTSVAQLMKWLRYYIAIEEYLLALFMVLEDNDLYVRVNLREKLEKDLERAIEEYKREYRTIEDPNKPKVEELEFSEKPSEAPK